MRDAEGVTMETRWFGGDAVNVSGQMCFYVCVDRLSTMSCVCHRLTVCKSLLPMSVLSERT